MADPMMRLRVVVLRNGLPETRYMLPVPLDGNPTIAKLLELVNNCTPIESDDWGLDDYSVELAGPDGSRSECLHFHPIKSILKEDDQVYIRALQTDDIKRRRVSGRYQISSDGKHLVDGVAFGRPLLRALTSRPPVFIPPRKRRRLLRESEEDEDQDEQATQQLLLTHNQHVVDNDDADLLEGTINANADFSPAESDSDLDEENDFDADEDLDDEVQALMKENAEIDIDMEDGDEAGASTNANEGNESTPRRRQPEMQELSPLAALRAAFPTAPEKVCQNILNANNNQLRDSYFDLLQAFKAELPETAVLSGQLFVTPARVKATSAATGSPQKQIAAPPTDQDDADADADMEDDNAEDGSGSDSDGDDVPDLVRRYDRCGLPPGSISSGHGLASMAAISGSFTSADSRATSVTMRPTKIIFEDEEPVRQPESREEPAADTSSSESSSSESEADTTSDEEDSSDSDSESDDEGGKQAEPQNVLNMDEDDSESDDGSFQGGSDGNSSDGSDGSEVDEDDNGSDSDSGPEETTTRKVVPSPKQAAAAPKHVQKSPNQFASEESSSSSDSDSSSDDSSSDEEDITIPSTLGSKPAPKPVSTSTQPTVAPGQGKAATKSRNARRRLAKQAQREQQQSESSKDTPSGVTSETMTGDPTLQNADDRAIFEAKRQALLDALANGGIEIGPGGSTNLLQPDSPASGTSKRKREEETQPQSTADDPAPAKTAGSPAEAQASTPDSQQKRQRFNLDAGKRLLFGALGLRAPKTADDAEKVRSKLMEDVRPHTNARLEAEKEKQLAATKKTTTDEDPDAWRQKISLRAVECVMEGIELSEPPFPFVMRWDPQQQGLWNGKKNKRGGKSKKADRDQSHYYEDGNRAGKKRKQDEVDESYYDDTTFHGLADLPDDNAVLNYDDPAPEEEMADATGEPSQYTDLDDLPSLPKDLSTLPQLHAQEAKVGMVITWKKMSCSAATQWQPTVSDVTAVVIRIENEGATLEMCLAKRDRHLDGGEKQYDEITGQRVYDKFEAPDLDSEDDDDQLDHQDDDGYCIMDFKELLEPRIVQRPANDELDQDAQAATNGNNYSDPAIALIPSIEQSSGGVFNGAANDDSSNKNLKTTTQEEIINRVVPAQEGQSLMPLSGGSSSNPISTSDQAGQGHQGSDIVEPVLSQDPSPSQHLSIEQPQPGEPKLMDESLEHPSGYEGDLDTQMTGNDDIVDETQLDETSLGEHAPTLFYEAQPQTSPLVMGDDVPMFDNDDDDIIAGTPLVSHPHLKAPSPVSSVLSGRQPDPTTTNLASVEPDTYRGADAHGDKTDGPSTVLESKPPDDYDPFASDDDRNSGKELAAGSVEHKGSVDDVDVTPKQIKISRSQSGKDAEYEAAMRELDGSSELSEDEISDSQKANEQPVQAPKRRLRAIKTEDGGLQHIDASDDDEDSEMPPRSKLPSLARATSINRPISPPPVTSARKPASKPTATATTETSFSIPAGSQIISLLSSDVEDELAAISKGKEKVPASQSDSELEPEPVFTENYADDDRDASYDPSQRDDEASLIYSGPGWVKKLHRAASARPVPKTTRKRGQSVTSSATKSSVGKRGTSRPSASQPNPVSSDLEDTDDVFMAVDASLRKASGSPPSASAPVQPVFGNKMQKGAGKGNNANRGGRLSGVSASFPGGSNGSGAIVGKKGKGKKNNSGTQSFSGRF